MRPAAAVLALLMLVGPVGAQTTTATLTGVVRDAAGHPVDEAMVQVLSEATGEARTAVTDSRGRFILSGLPAGAWQVVARRDDGAVSPLQEVELSLQQRLDLELVVGTAGTQEVEVRAVRPLLDSGRTGSELRVERDQVAHLPVAGRNVTDLALLDPAVRAPAPGGFYGERDAVFMVNGQSGRSNTFLVDGLDNNDLTSNTTLNAFFSQQVIREFVIMTSHFAPEFGRASGGVLNIITRRGTNQPVVEAFIQGAGAAMNQPGAFVDALPDSGRQDTDRRLQTGFAWGGPLKKDRSFFFLAWEHQDFDRVVPYTGIDRNGRPGGWIVGAESDDSLFLRTDFNLGNQNFLMLRLSGDERRTPGLNVGGVITPESGFDLFEKDIQLAATLTSVLGPGVLHEARLLLGGSSFEQRGLSSRPGVDRPGGLFGGNDLHVQLRDEERLQVVDNLTWSRGRHTFKAGLSLTRSRTVVRTQFNPNGAFLYETDLPFEVGDCLDLLVSDVADHYSKGNGKFDPIPCEGDDNGNGTPDEPAFIGTYPVVFRLFEGAPVAHLTDTSVGLFLQDSFQATDRLRLDYGLRYDLSSYTLPATARVDSVIPNGGAGRDTDNIAPRVGFTWALGEKRQTLLRGGAGLFYDKIVLGFPATASITSGTRLGLTFPQGLTFEFTEKELEEVGIDAVKAGLEFPEQFTLRFSTGTELDVPYTVQASVGVEHSLGRHHAVRASVTRALGYHQVLLRDLNPVTSLSPLGIPQHPDSTVGSIAAFVTEGRSWYEGLDLGWTWRGTSRRLSAGYTWSRSRDMGFDPLKGGISLPPDSDRLDQEIALSDAHRRHRVVLYGETGLPFFGLRVSGIIQLQSAAPFNVTTGEDDNVDGVRSDRLPGVGRNSGTDTPLGPVNARREALGLAPVRGLHAPSFAQVDVRLWKPFLQRADGTTGEFFIQAFNLLDRANGGPVEGRINSPRFGTSIGRLGPPLTFEVGLRLAF